VAAAMKMLVVPVVLVVLVVPVVVPVVTGEVVVLAVVEVVVAAAAEAAVWVVGAVWLVGVVRVVGAAPVAIGAKAFEPGLRPAQVVHQVPESKPGIFIRTSQYCSFFFFLSCLGPLP
jgi:hypothetical protein